MSLLDWFRSRAAYNPPPLRVAEQGPAIDGPEEQVRTNVAEQRIPTSDAIDGMAIAIEYADAVGEISVRRIVAVSTSRASEGVCYINGWCLLRNDWRRFRSDRILKLMLPPTWSAVSDPVEFLAEYVPQKIAARKSLKSVDPKLVCRDGLAILVYVARADGCILAAQEREVIRAYVVLACRRAGFDADEQTVERVLAYADTLYPTGHSMGQYLERLERDSGALDLLVPCLKSLVVADGHYSAEEQEAVAALLKAMSQVREQFAEACIKQESESEIVAPSPPLPASTTANFIALDVETANSDMASICSIGLVHFRQGEIGSRLNIMINPEDRFDPMNISIHGIRPEHVANAKTMAEVFPIVASALGSVVVVHHTHFDRVALCRAAKKHGFPEPTCQWLDSARVARRAWNRFSRSGCGLANLASEFSITFQHHDACEDARAAGMIMVRAMSDTGLSLDEWLNRIDEPLGEEESSNVVAGTSLTVNLTPEAERISSVVDAVKLAKREGRLDDARSLLNDEIEHQEAESRASGAGVAPWYYEQLAIVYRKQDREGDELTVLERYDRQIKAPGAAPAALKTRLEKVRAKLNSN